jgi:hypothetical protein
MDFTCVECETQALSAKLLLFYSGEQPVADWQALAAICRAGEACQSASDLANLKCNSCHKAWEREKSWV